MAIRDPEAEVWGFIPRLGLLDLILFIFQHGGNIVDDMENPTHTTFNDPLTVEAVQWYVDLIHTYQVSPTREGQGTGAGYNPDRLIREGKVGMWTGMFYERLDQSGEMLDMPGGLLLPFQVGMAPLPRDADSATYVDEQVYVISEDTEHADACWQWITFLSDQALRDNRLVPARISLVESQEFERNVGREAAEAARIGLQDALLIPSRVFIQLMGVGEAFSEAYDKIESGEWTAQEAMEWVQEQAEKQEPSP
jgi:ABC-type glycerol-3-phosphate transport system substrate-binding protein